LAYFRHFHVCTRSGESLQKGIELFARATLCKLVAAVPGASFSVQSRKKEHRNAFGGVEGDGGMTRWLFERLNIHSPPIPSIHG
jgi:hypothetical protein